MLYPKYHSSFITTLLISSLALTATTKATADELEQLLNLALDELLDIKVTSVSRREENLLTAPAAVYVISSEEIERSGVKTIQDALRMVPGLHVASIDSNKWVVSSRGFSGRYANKLLVQVDGRSVYSPSYSGVNWDMLNLPLALIERIEVIRGPGATLWGANAVNGVINILTKDTQQTTGSHAEIATGNQFQQHLSAHTTTSLSEDSALRFHIQHSKFDNNSLFGSNDSADDHWRSLNAGFRYDHHAEADSYTLQGELLNNKENQKISTLWLPAPSFIAQNVDDQFTAKGWHLLGRWQHQTQQGGQTSLQLYWDHNERDELYLGREHATFDIDFQYQLPQQGNHQIIVGAGYRYIDAEYDNSFAVSILPPDHTQERLSAFIQDAITLHPESLKLTVGSKFEYNDLTGSEIQPSIRLLWTPQSGHTLWAGISRAVRTPSLVESYGEVVSTTIPFTRKLIGSETLQPEKIIAYELGYRYYSDPMFHLDSTLFYNRYTEFSSYEHPSPDTIQIDNNLSGYTYGLELTANWQLTPDWLIKGSYSYLEIKMEHPSGNPLSGTALAENSSPEQSIQLLSQFDLNSHWKFDTWIYAVDNIGASSSVALSNGQSIEKYISLNAKLSWQFSRDAELSLIGHNLFDSQHLEYIGEFFSSATEIERSLIAQLKWEF